MHISAVERVFTGRPARKVFIIHSWDEPRTNCTRFVRFDNIAAARHAISIVTLHWDCLYVEGWFAYFIVSSDFSTIRRFRSFVIGAIQRVSVYKIQGRKEKKTNGIRKELIVFIKLHFIAFTRFRSKTIGYRCYSYVTRRLCNVMTIRSSSSR